MKNNSTYVLLALAALLLSACSERVTVGGGSEYVLVTPAKLGMDSHPGTSLQYKGEQVWRSIHPGYIHDVPQSFYRDEIFVFVGEVPSDEGYDHNKGPQIFAIHRSGPPVLISERAFHLSLTNSYFVDRITPSQDHFRVVIKYWSASKGDDSVTNNIAWADIVRWVKEAELSSLQQVTSNGTYKLLR